MSKNIELRPVLLNGMLYTVIGDFAITTDGAATRLEDQARSNSRFK